MVSDELIPIYLTVPIIESDIIERATLEQKLDKNLKPLIEYLETGLLPQNELILNKVLHEKKEFEMIKGRLYFKTADRRGQIKHLLVVPNSLRGTVLYNCHNTPFAAHAGQFRTECRVREYFYWDTLSQDVIAYCNSCESCAKTKEPRKPIRVPLQPIEPHAKFEKYHTDCLGPLPLTQKGNKFIITFIEALTRYCIIIPIPNLTAEVTADAFLKSVVLKWGVPKYLTSDNGSCYTSALMKGIEKLIGTKPVFTSSWHPQSNSVAERPNRTIAKAISHYLDRNNQKCWDEVVPYIEFALNTAVSSSLHESSFYLLYLCDVAMPLTAALDLPSSKYREIKDYKLDMQDLFREATECTRKALLAAQQKQKHYYNKTTKAHDLIVGNLVYLYVPIVKKQNVRKLSQLWRGPYRVLDLTERRALIRLANNRWSKAFWVNVDRLKICNQDTLLDFANEDENEQIIDIIQQASQNNKSVTELVQENTTDNKSITEMVQNNNSDINIEQTKSPIQIVDQQNDTVSITNQNDNFPKNVNKESRGTDLQTLKAPNVEQESTSTVTRKNKLSKSTAKTQNLSKGFHSVDQIAKQTLSKTHANSTKIPQENNQIPLR